MKSLILYILHYWNTKYHRSTRIYATSPFRIIVQYRARKTVISSHVIGNLVLQSDHILTLDCVSGSKLSWFEKNFRAQLRATTFLSWEVMPRSLYNIDKIDGCTDYGGFTGSAPNEGFTSISWYFSSFCWWSVRMIEFSQLKFPPYMNLTSV